VTLRVGLAREVELCHAVAPPEELAAKREAVGCLSGEVGESQNPFVAALQGLGLAEPAPSMHLVGDHQDLLIAVEASPAFETQACMLGHGNGSPRPMSANVISWILASSSGAIRWSMMTIGSREAMDSVYLLS